MGFIRASGDMGPTGGGPEGPKKGGAWLPVPGVGLGLKDPHEKGEPRGSIKGEPIGSIQGPRDPEEKNKEEDEEDISDKCLIIKS